MSDDDRNDRDYASKYLKYKQKYLALKSKRTGKQTGGARKQRGGDVSFEEAADEIHFWGHQEIEHNEYLRDELKEEPYKGKAEMFRKKWSDYMQQTFAGIEEHKIVLDSSDFAKIGGMEKLNLDKVKQMIADQIQFHMDIKVQHENKYIGFNYPAENMHMLKETKHFDDNLNGRTTPDKLAKFAAEEAAEHTILAHKLLDPAAKLGLEPMDKIKQNTLDANQATLDGAMKVKTVDTSNPEAVLKYITELGQAGEDLADKIKTNQVESIINPDLIDHEGRETKRCIAKLQKLGKPNY